MIILRHNDTKKLEAEVKELKDAQHKREIEELKENYQEEIED